MVNDLFINSSPEIAPPHLTGAVQGNLNMSMKNYDDLDVEDLISDTTFIDWILKPELHQDSKWSKIFNERPDQHNVIERARNIILSLNIKPVIEPLSFVEKDEISANVFAGINQTTRRSTIKHLFGQQWFKVAAMLLLIVAIGVILWGRRSTTSNNTSANMGVLMVSYANNSNTTKVVRLNDGSLVLLRANSTLRYPVKFVGAYRRVNLTGEAYFEVSKDATHPFLIRSNDLITRVLGTSFTINDRPGKQTCKVEVSTGRVQVIKNNITETIHSAIILAPGQQALLNRSTGELTKAQLDSGAGFSNEVLTSFSFTNAPLSVIVNKLERYYHTPIAYDHNKFSNSTITASLGRLTLEQKVVMICKAIDARYELDHGTISIK
jgi:transmembrane sensor